VIAELNRRRTEMENAEAEIRRLQQETALLQKEAEKKQGGLEAQREKILRSAREEARAILQEAKDTADKAIRQLHREGQSVSREQEEARGSLRLALNEADEQLQEADRKDRRVTVTEKKLRIGDAVYVHSLKLKGTVSTLPDARGKLFVQMGILRSQVDASDLELLPEETVTLEGKKRSAAQGGSIRKAMTISPEINLIGMTRDEALSALDKYMDDAAIAHLEKVRIIHGRGTGTLRDAVASYLRRDPRVDHYETAPYNEGGYGATVAVMKKA
jgi:DNA mismatch repair protein MutS2